MKLVITPEESARLDAASIDPVDVLMERAGLGVALAAVAMGVGYGSRVVVLAGTGNNGGDGYVAARWLMRRGAAVTVHALGESRNPDSAAGSAAARAQAEGVPVVAMQPPARPPDLVIDAVFGVGFRGSLPPAVDAWRQVVAPVLAVDLPSGLDAMTGTGDSLVADRTITFHALKPGHLVGEGPERCGHVDVRDIGLVGGDPFLRLCEEGDAPLPPRIRTAHKWSTGSVLVIGGSPGITGAPVLAAKSALAAGAGAAAVACPGQVAPVIAGHDPGVMTVPIGAGDRFDQKDTSAVLEAATRYDVVVLGPGLGKHSADFAEAVMTDWPGPLLMDADGLPERNGAALLRARAGGTVITPHAGEFRRLTGRVADHETAGELAAETGAVVLLKGNPTFVLGEERWVVTSGGPELATIGTGDVLAGAVAALWARGLAPEIAARSGAFSHGQAGVALAQRTTVTATELIGELGRWA